MRTHLLLVFASVALSGFAPAPFPRPDRARFDPLDVTGTWEFEACEMNGTNYDDTKTKYNAEIKKDRFTFVAKQGASRTDYDMRLDAGAAPASFTWGTGNSVGWVGSYQLKGDRLTLIFGSGTSVTQRPTDFGGKPQWRYVLRRIKR